jgi:hypothetical protein
LHAHRSSAQTTDTLILQASRSVFATTDGAYLQELNDPLRTQLDVAIKRVLGIAPDREWNASVIRSELDDQHLVTLALLAVVGNFTTGFFCARFVQQFFDQFSSH